MDKMNSFKSNTDNELIKPAFINNEDGTVKVNYDNLEEKTRLSHFSPVLLKKKDTKLVFLYKGQRYAVDTKSEESRENCKETLNKDSAALSIGPKKKQVTSSGCFMIQTIFMLESLGFLNICITKRIIRQEIR